MSSRNNVATSKAISKGYHNTLSDFVEATATKFGIPGVAVGVWVDGQAIYACHGVTSIDHPLPVDQHTLYVLGSVTKTYTVTALMRLVASGQIELEAPVRRYVPELRLADERAAAEVTVLNLLNHTSGLDWGIIVDTGEGDDALAVYVAKLAELEQISPPGARASYSQAGYNFPPHSETSRPFQSGYRLRAFGGGAVEPWLEFRGVSQARFAD